MKKDLRAKQLMLEFLQLIGAEELQKKDFYIQVCEREENPITKFEANKILSSLYFQGMCYRKYRPVATEVIGLTGKGRAYLEKNLHSKQS